MKLVEMPDKWTFVIIVLVSLVIPAFTLWGMFNTPEGFEYGHGRDGIIWVSAMKSHLWGYVDPFGPGTNNVFENPWMGSIYLLSFLGFFTTFLDAEFILHAATFIFAVLFFIVAYNLIGLFVDKKDLRKAFLYFIFASGSIGWILYLFFKVPVEALFPGAFLHLLWSAGISTPTVIYWCASLIFGYFALLMFAKRKSKRTLLTFSIALGIATLIYPLFGMTAALLTLIYSILYRKFRQFLFSIPFVVAGIAPWLYFKSPFYTRYLIEPSHANLLVFLFRGLFILPPALYLLYLFIKNYKRKTISKRYAFLIAWGITIVILVLTPSKLIGITTERFTYMVWLPLSIAGFIGLKRFFSGYSIKTFHVVATIIIVVTTPTLIFWFGTGLHSEQPYFPKSDIDALKFLKDHPQGTILASYNISVRAPYYANKRALRGGGQLFEEVQRIAPVIEAYEKFYSVNASDEQRREILERYHISYVIFGDEEKKISMGIFDPNKLSFLKKLLDGLTKVYSFEGVV